MMPRRGTRLGGCAQAASGAARRARLPATKARRFIYSIISSARANTAGGIVRPRVFGLTASVNVRHVPHCMAASPLRQGKLQPVAPKALAHISK
jgi:hypothetical protein